MAEDESLLERILDGAEDPTDLPLALLQRITNNFSEERKIGQGGFGVVYKGVLRERIVAVKRIHINENTFDDRLFRREFASLRNTNHRNVVRFLGFCSSTYQKTIEDARSGEAIFANVLERLLCFEYIANGSLDKHITDELRGLEWETRYEIIIGVCKGLRYLHEDKQIIHMDLKPENILLDHQDRKYMVAKITDFGLSRPNKNSHTAGLCFGTLGYLAPEYRENSKTTPACDVYSLGVIITELVTGCRDVPNEDNVLRRWRHRWNKPPTQLQYQQVTRCINIARRCTEQKPEARPSVSKIISFLSESQTTYGQISPRFDEDDMLWIKPLELRLPSEIKNQTSCSVELTNGTRNCIAFNIQLPSLKYIAQPEKGIVEPKSKCRVKITVQPRDGDDADKFIVKSMKVSQVLRHDDITERMFEEASKFVDKVDLMVVYEPAKPPKNSRSREDTNVPAEEVPKAKKGKIVESASKKDKSGSSENAEATSMDINSSTQEQCTGQTEQCKLHTLQSFSRHYPTNLRYLERASDRAVDFTRGAMGSLLDKLGKLVTDDYSLDTSIKRDIESLSEDLMIMQRDLPKLENVDGAKIWVDEVRDLSYYIEDIVDCFLVHVEPNSSGSGFKELTHEGLKLLVNGIPTQQQIDYVVTDIKNKVQAMGDKQKKYNFDVKCGVANTATKTTIDHRMLAIYNHTEKLVGIKKPRDELIRLLQKDGDASRQKLKIISIVGMGGLGKTTLAKAVSDKLKAYRPKAFVPVGQNPDVVTVLKNIISEVEKDFNSEKLILGQLIKELQKLLKNKRFLIVIDDIWDSSAWDVIQSAFPRNNHGSRVIITTRNHDVALACCHRESKYVYRIKSLSDEESRKLLFRRAFGHQKYCPVTPREEEISKCILKRCGGMPLAINSIASLLAGKPETAWENVWKSLGALTEGKTALDNMKQILDLSYVHLPDHLKTCLLYVCKYPEDREIYKNDLLRQWVAEGLVSTFSVLDAEDVAENYFQELIDMCMIQPEKIDYNNEVFSCRVHDIILDLMRSKSTEVNFIQVIDGSKDVTGTRGEIRRVSVQFNDKEDSIILATVKGSLKHVRSVSLYRTSVVPYFLEFKYVRVLHIEQEIYSDDPIDLTGISKLFLLRYLKVALCRYGQRKLKLPDNIGQLQQLETIDLQGCRLNNYPSDIVTLPRLSHLRYIGRRDDELIALPDRIDMLKSLNTLQDVYVDESTVDSIKNLGKLTNLRNLQIKSHFICKPEEENQEMHVRMNALHSSISRISTSLRILSLDINIYSYNTLKFKCYSDWSRTLFPQGSHIRELYLCGCFKRCPEWIGQLHGLNKFTAGVQEVGDGVSIAGGLPSLAYFELFIHILLDVEAKVESVVISGSGAFQALKELKFSCPMASLTFEPGALPKLEKLDIGFRPLNPRKFLPAGIEHLPAPTLRDIRLSVYNFSFRKQWKVKGSEQWNDSVWEKYFDSEYYERKLDHKKKLMTPLKRACKLYHPSADIHIFFDNERCETEDEEDYDEDGDEEYDYDNEDFCKEDYFFRIQDDEASYQGNGSQTSAQVQANTRQVELTEMQKDSGRMSINADAAPIVDTSLHLAVRYEGRQGVQGSQDLAFCESLHLPSTSLVASSPSSLNLTLALSSLPDRIEPLANFPVNINEDLLVQQVNNSSLVNAMGQYFELNQPPQALLFDHHQAPPTGFLDLNQAPPAGLLDLSLASPDEATNTTVQVEDPNTYCS